MLMMNKHVKPVGRSVIAVITLLSMFSALGAPLTLIDNGKSNYEIICANDTASATEGAKEMQSFIKLVTGVQLPIKAELSEGKDAIVIGAHPLADAAGIKGNALKKDGFIMRTVGENIFLVGNDKDLSGFFAWSPFIESSNAGSYFAVMEFARRFLGMEWYMPGSKGMEWKSASTVAVPASLDIKEEPHFVRRMIEGAWLTSERSLEKKVKSGFLKRNYYNKDIARECETWGRRMLLGNGKFVPFQHAWFMFVPAKEPNKCSEKAYGKDHPEYYALLDGVRTNYYKNGKMGGQLCTSNPDVVKTYANNIISYGKKNGKKGFSLSNNDGAGNCQCANCTALDGKNPITGEQVMSDRLLTFSNQIAEQVSREIPDARLGVYAYHATRYPPVVPMKIHKNVYISDVYNMLPNLWYSGAKERARIIHDLKTWREQAKHVSLCSYYSIYGSWSLPWDTTEVIGDVIKIISKYNSSDGMTMNDCRYFGLAPGVDGARLWVLARLLWNPNQSSVKLQKQFYIGAFGKNAGRYIEEYFNTINQSMIKVMKETPMDWENQSGALECTYPLKAYLPIQNKCRELIDKAVASAAGENERIRWRVDRVALGWRFAELTMEAICYERMARSGTYKDEGLTQAAVWGKAVRAGKARRAMVNDSENYYAIAQASVDQCTRQRPLGIVEKIPESIHMKLAAPLVKKPVIIDGKLDDAIWNQLTPTRNFVKNREGSKSVVTTWTKVCRTADALILGYYCGEPQMDKLITVNKPATIWKGDVAEFYLSSNGSRMDYVQFLVNPNSIGKAYFMRGDRGIDANWNPDWEYKAHKGKDHWSVEMKIPFASLALDSANIETETPFVNFFRERYTQTSENSGWCPTGGGFAQPGKYGRIVFTDHAAAQSSKKDRTRVSILKNGSFESGKISPWYWYDKGWGPKKQTGKVLSSRAKSGKHCILAEHPGDNKGYYIITTNVSKLQPGKTYRFEVWVKPEGFDNGSRSGISLRVLGGGKNGKNSKPVCVNDTWQCLSLRYLMPDDTNFVNLYIRFHSKKPASVLIDNAGFFLEN
jgi:uncharacterized protein DUF4838/carbohydrate binding protein with CBM4/9 domain